jgi:hypothetical protein
VSRTALNPRPFASHCPDRLQNLPLHLLFRQSCPLFPKFFQDRLELLEGLVLIQEGLGFKEDGGALDLHLEVIPDPKAELPPHFFGDRHLVLPLHPHQRHRSLLVGK